MARSHLLKVRLGGSEDQGCLARCCLDHSRAHSVHDSTIVSAVQAALGAGPHWVRALTRMDILYRVSSPDHASAVLIRPRERALLLAYIYVLLLCRCPAMTFAASHKSAALLLLLPPLLTGLLSSAGGVAAAAGLNDPRISSQLPAISLDGSEWRATSSDGSLYINARVPGEIITDLQRAGKIGDPLYELNWKKDDNVRLWNQTWTYSRVLPAALLATTFRGNGGGTAEMLLIFDGIKMGATIKLNGKKIGEATDQFVKYNFSIAEGLLAQVDRQGTLQDSTLEVVFDLPTNGRFAACSGGWDWGPYSNTYQVCTALHAVHGLAAWPTSIACRVRG
jgi:hypothetical protein